MLKRNTALFIKLLLIILLVLLFWFILSRSKAELAEADIESPSELEVVWVKPAAISIPEPEPEPEHYQEVIEQSQEEDPTIKIKQWEEEHYYATKIWEYLRQRGFSQAVTCGIIGNMMIETSGGSLDLKPSIYSPSGNYYGLCQWSKKYYPEAHGLSFEQQLDYLLESIIWEINTFGKCYKEGFNYEDFLAITDPAKAALAFAKSYERCGPASYELRKQAAKKAYEYFSL